MTTIKFGTSGWRAIISEEFTFDNVKLVTQAIANYLKKTQSAKRKAHNIKVVVGYDTRFLSKEFADACAKVLAANRIKVLLSNRDVPTPVISYQILKNKASGGINFTASHNPPEYNGIKFSPDTGAPAPPEVTKKIEEEIKKLQKMSLRPRNDDQNYLKYIKTFDPKPAYLSQIKKVVKFDAIEKAKLKIAVDCMYGTARGYLDFSLKDAGCKLYVLHDWLNPYFDGKRPEPAQENIKELIGLVRKNSLNIGLGCDGDADRFGIVDSDGTVITANQVISLLFYHLLKTRPKNKNQIVVRTVATTHMIDAIAQIAGVKVYETPVGFKYFVDYLKTDDCIIAGEESGGLSIGAHLPEKDGILACLLIAEMVAINKKPLKKLLDELYKKFGYFYFERQDLHMKEDAKNKLMDKMINDTPKIFAGQVVAKTDKRDGCKLLLCDGSWALFRPSGTEPIVRFYAEAKTSKRLSELLTASRNIVHFT